LKTNLICSRHERKGETWRQGCQISNQRFQFGKKLEGPGVKNVVIFYDHFENVSVIWYNLWPFGIVCGHLIYFFPFWYVETKKNLAALLGGEKNSNLKGRRASQLFSHECPQIL
jgi:hypothetical protein